MRLIKPNTKFEPLVKEGEPDEEYYFAHSILIEDQYIVGPSGCRDPACDKCSYAIVWWSLSDEDEDKFMFIDTDDFEPKVVFSGDQLLEPALN